MNQYDDIVRMDFTLTDGKIGYRRITLEARGGGRFDRWFGPTFSYEHHEPSGPLTLRQSGSLIAALEDADPLSWNDVSRRLTHLGGIEWGFSFTLEDGTTFCKVGENNFPDTFEILLDEMVALGLPMPEEEEKGF